MRHRISSIVRASFLNARDTSGRQSCAIHLAARNGDEKSIRMLLELGASRTVQDNMGHSAATVAKNLRRNEQICRMLDARPPAWVWSRGQHHRFPRVFQREVHTLLLAVKRTNVHLGHDVLWMICNQLLQLHRN